LQKAGNIYLDTKGSLWYKFGNILHKFSWGSCLRSGGVSIVDIDKGNMRINLTPSGFDRDALRKTNFVWTLDL